MPWIAILLPFSLLACSTGASSDDDDDGGDVEDTGLSTGEGTGTGGGVGTSGDDDGSGAGGGSGSDAGTGSGDSDGGTGGTGSDGSGGGTGDEGPAPLLPTPGAWVPSNFSVSSDPCSLTDFEDPSAFIPSAFDVSDVSSAGFSISEPGAPSTRCAYTEPDFTCEVSTASQDVGFGLDAVLLLDNVFSGTVRTEQAIDGRIDLSVTCDGSACGLLEVAGLAFPCPLEGTFDLAR